VRCDERGGGGRNSGDGGRGAAEEAAVEEAAEGPRWRRPWPSSGDDRAAVVETRSRRRRHLSPATSVQIAVGGPAHLVWASADHEQAGHEQAGSEASGVPLVRASIAVARPWHYRATAAGYAPVARMSWLNFSIVLLFQRHAWTRLKHACERSCSAMLVPLSLLQLYFTGDLLPCVRQSADARRRFRSVRRSGTPSIRNG